MVFSSITFIFCFLPIFLILYFLVPDRYKNAVLFLASLTFYFYGIKDHPAYLALILLSILVNHLAAGRIASSKSGEIRKKWLVGDSCITWAGYFFLNIWTFLFET